MSFNGKRTRVLSKDERLWNQLSKRAKSSADAKMLFQYIKKMFGGPVKTIAITYKVDDSAIVKATKSVRALQSELRKFGKI